MAAEPTGLTRLASLDYGPLTAKPDRTMVDGYLAQCVVADYDEATGFDEQKVAWSRHKPDIHLWERRYQLAAFAWANGMSYAFRSNPRHWPGMVRDDSKLHDVLQGASSDGHRFMACALEITRSIGALTGRDIQFDYYTVIALKLGTKDKQVGLKHRWRTHADALDLLEANYALDEPFNVMWHARDEQRLYDVARLVLTPEVLAVILRVAPGYNMFLTGGWIYLMKTHGLADVHKKHASLETLRERFEIAAQAGPALIAAAAAHAAPGSAG